MFVIDVETTNLTAGKGEMLTLGLVVTDDELNITFEKEYKFKPVEKHQWCKIAQSVHGISWKEAQKFPEARESFDSFINDCTRISDKDNTFLCHSAAIFGGLNYIDYQFLMYTARYLCKEKNSYVNKIDKLFPANKVKSTILKSPKQAKLYYGVEDQKLKTWIKKLNLKGKHHSAIDDARFCLEVYKYQQRHEQELG